MGWRWFAERGVGKGGKDVPTRAGASGFAGLKVSESMTGVARTKAARPRKVRIVAGCILAFGLGFDFVFAGFR